MDIPIYIGLGLVASGYFLNKEGKQARRKPVIDTQKKDDQIANKKSGGNNIYDSGYFQKVREIEDERVITNFEKSFDPINTNIIPHFFNTLSETQLKRVNNPKYDKNLFKKELTKVMKTTPIQLSQLEPTPNDLTDLNQNGAFEVGGLDGSPPRGLYAETELNKGWGELMTRPSFDRDTNNRDGTQMIHNNMTPFFGGSTRQNMDIDNRMMADKLETFTGQFKLDQNHKVEASPMFAPVQQNLEQLVEPRELDRYVTSIQIRNNELPFEQIQVGPGLNDGYTARPSGGFHNPLRILPKTIDQLLVNPRVAKEGRVIRGKDPVDQRTAQMKQYKYKPELLVTNFNGERNFTTVGVKVKPMTRSGIVQKPTERQKSRKILGQASSQSGSKRTAMYLLPKSKISTKVNFKNTPFRNAVKTDGKKHHNNQQLRFENRDNERSTTQVKYGEKGFSFTNCKFDTTRGQIYQHDKAKKTRKQSYVVAPNPTGYVNISIPKGTVYDPANQTKTTVRETTEQNTHTGYIQTNGIKGIVYDTKTELPQTIRETTGLTNYIGQVKNDQDKGLVYDPNFVPKTTVRETCEQNSHNGYIQTSNIKGQVYDPFDSMRTTVRQTTEDNNHNGHVQVGGVKGVVYDTTQLTKTTTRQTTENNDHMGHMNQTQGQKGKVYDIHDVTRTTIKETVENNNHMGHVNQTNGQKGKVYNDNDPTRTTIRETIENNNHTGHINQTNGQRGKVYNDHDLAKTTTKETTENNDHAGHMNQTNGQRGKVYDVNDTAKTTIRETVENNDHLGYINQINRQKGKVYDVNDVSRTTIRETTEKSNHLGHANQSTNQKGKVYDVSEQAKTTVRETTENTKYLAGNHTSQNNKQITYNPNSVAKTTIKETTEQGDYMGVVCNSQKIKQIVYDPFDVPSTTHRETTEQHDYLMPSESTTLQNGTGYQTAPTDTKNTQRQFYSDYYHINGAGQAGAPTNQQLYDSAYNMRQDNVKEVVAEGRYPTLSGVKVTLGKTGVNMEIKKLEDDRVNHYSAMRAPINCNQRKPMNACELTSFKNNLPATNTYFDPSILKPYIENPLSQSLQSWA